MYLIVGANGFLGNYLIQSILELTDEKIIAASTKVPENTDRVEWMECNILQDEQFCALVDKVKDVKNLKVIFLAAFHHPDKVAENPEYAWNVNVTTLSKCVNKLSFASRLFYASTDSVYGNSIEHYHFKEEDILSPVNIYGKNKAAAEAIIRYSGFNVVRYPFLIAPSLVKGKEHFYDHIVNSLKAGKEVEMFCDSYRSSLNFKTAAELMIKLCELPSKVPAILNVCGDDDLSKYDIGLMIADKFGFDKKVVKPIYMNDNTGEIFKSARALSTLMDNTKVKKILRLDTIKFELY